MADNEVVPGRVDLPPGHRGGGSLPRLTPPHHSTADLRTLTAREAYETAIADAQCWLARNGHRAASLALPEMPGSMATGLEYRGG